MSGVVDNALYPVLFVDCLRQLFTPDDMMYYYLNESMPRLVIITVFTCFFTYLTYRGLDVVENMAIILCVLSLCPFVVFCVVGMFQVDPSRWAMGRNLNSFLL